MIIKFFREVATSPNCPFYPMANTTIIAFNTDSKELTNLLSKAFKASNETIPCITGNNSTRYTQGLKFGSKLPNGLKVSLSPYIGNDFACDTMVSINQPLFVALFANVRSKFIYFQLVVMTLFRRYLVVAVF